MLKTKCNICNSNNYKVVFKAKDRFKIFKNEFQIVKCSTCGLIYLNPALSNKQIIQAYPKKYWSGRNRHDKHKYRKIHKIRESGLLLDIGCAEATFLYYIKKKGWEVKGIELSKSAVRFAKKKFGLDINEGSVIEQKFCSKKFDVITMWNVLEHTPNPLEIVQECSRILKDTGVLFIQVPNIESFQAKILKDSWGHIDAPRHYYHFSIYTLKMLLNNAGFRICNMDTCWMWEDVNLWVYFIMSFWPLSVLTSKCNETKTNKISNILLRICNGILLRGFFIIIIPFYWILCKSNSGATLNVFAVKNEL